MAFRNILIESPARISCRNRQLIICTDCDHSVAIEDISALLIESRQSVITAAALSELGQSGCAVFVCDEKHLPAAVLTPYARHSRALSVLRSQMEASEPQKKRLWKQIVEMKIGNQARCLRLCGQEAEADSLAALASRVKSGDPDNVEAVAAARYFPRLFGRGFVRGDENGQNAALNYGYAILRGCAARCLAVYGFLPALGLHHRSELNSFNLADDLMEPFRPVVDLLAARHIGRDDELTPERKRMLFNCLNLDVLSGMQRHSVSYAMERLTHSLARSLERGEAELTATELTELRQHRYE